MRNRSFYEVYFLSYPDVVTLPQFREMMGGMSETSARFLMKNNLVKNFLIRGTYYIPKKYIIDYVLSTHYAIYRNKLKAHIP